MFQRYVEHRMDPQSGQRASISTSANGPPMRQKRLVATHTTPGFSGVMRTG